MNSEKELYILKIAGKPLEIAGEIMGVDRIEKIEKLERVFKKITPYPVEISKLKQEIKDINSI